jgi:hypothetical protein
LIWTSLIQTKIFFFLLRKDGAKKEDIWLP